MMIYPSKNLALSGTLTDLFLALVRVSSVLKSGEYSSIRFWASTFPLKKSRDLVSLSKNKVDIFDYDQMHKYLESMLPLAQIEDERKFFIPKTSSISNQEKFNTFISRFFPSIENWTIKELMCGYEKEFPFILNAKKKDIGSPYVVIVPFCSIENGDSEQKIEFGKWSQISNYIRRTFPELKIVVLGESSDKINRENERNNKETIDLRGKLSLEEEISYVYGSFLTAGVFSIYTLVSLWGGIPSFIFSQVPKSISKYAFPENFSSFSFSKIFFNEDTEINFLRKKEALSEVLRYANDHVSRRI